METFGQGRDPITGLPDDRAFREDLRERFRDARETERNGALLAISLDDIMNINARHGRSGGNEALRGVGAVLTNPDDAPVKATQRAFALGGPTFGVVIPQCTAEEARRIAESICQQVNRSKLFLEPLSVSIGIVSFYEHFPDDGSNEEIALHAEQIAVYRLSVAQAHGGNGICDSSETTHGTEVARTGVLIVEPDLPSLELLMRSLDISGFAVRTCEDGVTAYSLAVELRPGVIISEAMAPGLDGFALRERMRGDSLLKTVPFILVSYKKTEQYIQQAVRLDIRHFFRKPITISEVTGLVKNLTGRSDW